MPQVRQENDQGKLGEEVAPQPAEQFHTALGEALVGHHEGRQLGLPRLRG
jgi:hypothetical protein